MIELNKMAGTAFETAQARARKGQLKTDTMSLLKHCAGEVVEATEAYDELCFFSDEEYVDKMRKTEFADELGDIITCALIAAAQEGVDIEAALLRVQEKNARRAEQ
ncbi:MAG: hypothetical protein NC548_39030 [Lachnospiraceae bacterium]|nr:hypothetical protein [Lachnospiraceae bacterium]